MKIAISAAGNSLESEVDMRFGRCPYFIFVELEGKEIKGHEVVENTSANQTGGVGITSAELVAKKGAQAVLTGNVGPRAFSVFSQFNIGIYPVTGKIIDAIKAFADGKLKKIDEPTGPMMHHQYR
ncbi:NifB/NifX family molybdenum-iron cluster-binding protein [Candidatus Woesearchaeota archaeon]|nr:NifB/NifX family molybdenum-iron cluster-binding protein [Candidatus Woesearchaeota archaeon]